MKHLVTRKENSAVEVVLTFTKEEINAIKGNILKEMGKKVEVPGFRKGHAPVDKIEANYADALKEELVDALLKANYETVLKSENINPVSYIYNVDAKTTEEGYAVNFTVDEFPVVTLGEYKGLEVEKRTANVTPEALNHAIEALVAQKTELMDAEEGYKAVMGDTVDLAFDGSIDGVPFEGGKADSHSLVLGSKMFIDTFEEQLVGYVVGQEGEVNVNFPVEYGHAPLAGKPAVFKVKINSIKKAVKPELNDEFAVTLGFESLADLNTKKTAELLTKEEQMVKNEIVSKLLTKIVEASEASIPNSMIMREVENKVKEMEQHLSAQGANLEMYLKMMGKTFEQMAAEMTPMATNKVKTDIVLEEIAKAENLVVTEEEMAEKMAEVAVMYGMDTAKLEAELKKNNNLEAFTMNLNVDVTLQKAVDFIVASSK
ncbi:MAG: trigger factor [Fusobacteriaceae bacterium]